MVTQLMDNPNRVKHYLHYFQTCFPWSHWSTILAATEDSYSKKQLKQVPTLSAWVKHIGLILTMALNRIKGGRAEHWGVGNKDHLGRDTVFEGGNFGQKYGVTRDVFDLFVANFKLIKFNNTDKMNDPWIEIRSFVDAFNKNNAEIFKRAGNKITIDEAMCEWEGADLKYTAEGMPHVTKIPRKPKGIGCEFKATADSLTGCLVFLEIQEGQEAMRNKKYMDKWKNHTAVTLRSVEKYFSTGRTVTGDSAFASLDTCIALMENGLNFDGIVKTCHSKYPLDYFKLWQQTSECRPGSHKVLIHNIQYHDNNIIHIPHMSITY